MAELIPFSNLPCAVPDAAVLERVGERHWQAWHQARTAAAQLDVICNWDRDAMEWETTRTLSRIRFSLNTRDSTWRAKEERLDALESEVGLRYRRQVGELLASPHRASLEAALGPHAFTLWKLALETGDRKAEQYVETESRLVRRYLALVSDLRLTVDGKEVTLAEARCVACEPDRDRRYRARLALDRGYAAITNELDDLFDELFTMRVNAAKALGRKGFTELAYRRLGRTDYGPAEVARFRRQVQDQVVPVVVALRERQARRLGLSDYAFHDETVSDPRGAPALILDTSSLVRTIPRLLSEVDPDFADVFERLAASGYVDVLPGAGKVGGAGVESLPKYGVPFLRAALTGGYDDVAMLAHEYGHALQFWLARDQPLGIYHWPSSEACEIPSLGMELLLHPHFEALFGDNAERARRSHLEDTLGYMLFDLSADAFQHEVYASQHSSPARRDAIWKSSEAMFMPWRSYRDLPWFERGRGWQTYDLIFRVPFYAIDYPLASICALQLFTRACNDRSRAIAAYRALCMAGGSLPFTQLLARANLDSPFDSDVVERTMAAVADALDL